MMSQWRGLKKLNMTIFWRLLNLQFMNLSTLILTIWNTLCQGSVDEMRLGSASTVRLSIWVLVKSINKKNYGKIIHIGRKKTSHLIIVPITIFDCHPRGNIMLEHITKRSLLAKFRGSNNHVSIIGNWWIRRCINRLKSLNWL